MDINELKKLLKKSTAVLVLDNGDPSYVILDYETYKELVLKDKSEEKEIKINNGSQMANGNGKTKETLSAIDLPQKPKEEEIEILERINKDILAIKNEIEKKLASIDPVVDFSNTRP